MDIQNRLHDTAQEMLLYLESLTRHSQERILSSSRAWQLVAIRQAMVMVLSERYPAVPIGKIMACVRKDRSGFHSRLKDHARHADGNPLASPRWLYYSVLYARLSERYAASSAKREKRRPKSGDFRCRMVVTVMQISSIAGIPLRELFLPCRKRSMVHARTAIVAGLYRIDPANVTEAGIARLLGRDRSSIRNLRENHTNFISRRYAGTTDSDIERYRALNAKVRSIVSSS